MSLTMLLALRTAQAGCAVPEAPCDPEGIPICAESVCDLAPYPTETTGTVLYLVSQDNGLGPIRAFGTDAHGNAFSCEASAVDTGTLTVTGSNRDDAVYTWATGPLCTEDDAVRLPTFGTGAQLVVSLGAGTDLLDARHRGRWTVTAYGGPHADTLLGGQETPFGGGATCIRMAQERECEGLDTLLGEGGDDVIVGESYDGTFASTGGDVLLGGAGDDTITGSDLVDLVRGGPGDDAINGRGASDRLFGDRGADFLCGFGDFANDQLSGGPDDDVLRGGMNALRIHHPDDLDGGPGVDECGPESSPVRVNCEAALSGDYTCP